MKSIGYHAFDNCYYLNTISIPNGIISIDDYAFAHCLNLTSIIMPNSLSSIGSDAFYCCGITSIRIPNSVNHLGNNAFRECDKLENVKVEWTTPISITRNVFSNRTNATLQIPAGSKTAYTKAYYWKEFKNIVEYEEEDPIITFADANVKTLCVANWDTNGDGELSMSEAAAVTDLGSVFKYKSDISSFNELQYFTGLNSIGSYAFSLCSKLESIAIPASVTSIGSSAFSSCSNLASISIPANVTSIGNSAFSSCSGLSSITVESENDTYDSRNNCNAIIRKSDNTLIVGCKNTVIPNTVNSIGSNAFYYCKELTSITIPSSVTSIGGSAFSGCSALTSITIPNSVTTIGSSAFGDCTSLTTVTIPYSVTSLGGNPFTSCKNVTSISVASGNEYYYSPNNCNAIIRKSDNALIAGCKNTIIPNIVTSIGSRAFYSCESLTSISIPSSVTSIDTYAFCGCYGLKTITIPGSIKTIGANAFQNCNGLTSINIPNGVTSIGEYNQEIKGETNVEIIPVSA